MRAILILAVLAFLPSPSFGQGADGPPERETSLIVYGGDPCPPAEDGEIVVCAREPEGDRYRIPEELRRSSKPPELGGISRIEALEESQRDTRPGSCSVVGSFGHTGCTQELIRQWQADRRARRRQP